MLIIYLLSPTMSQPYYEDVYLKTNPGGGRGSGRSSSGRVLAFQGTARRLMFWSAQGKDIVVGSKAKRTDVGRFWRYPQHSALNKPCPHRLRHWNTWSLGGGLVCGGHGTFRRCSFVGESTWLGTVSRVCSLALLKFTVFCAWLKMWSPSFHLGTLAAMPPFLLWTPFRTISQNSLFHKSLLGMPYLSQQQKQLMHMVRMGTLRGVGLQSGPSWPL